MYDAPEAALFSKGAVGEISYELCLPETVSAPVSAGRQLGKLRVLSNGELLCEVPLTAASDVDRAGFGGILLQLLRSYASSAPL